MKVKFIAKIIEDLIDLNSVTYTFTGRKYNESVNFTAAFIDKTVNGKNNFFAMHPKAFANTSRIDITLNYKSGKTKKFRYNEPLDLQWKPEPAPIVVPKEPKHFCVRYNSKSPFEDNEQHRQMVLSNVAAMCEDVEDLQEQVYGTKNLIYYTVFGDGYLELLNYSLQSIDVNCTNKNFDILIICHESMVDKVNALEVTSKFNIQFMNVPVPDDGIEASKNKCRVFEWSNINEYNKALFLDCDILSLKDVNVLFEKPLLPGKLYTVYNVSNKAFCDYEAHNKQYHSVSPIAHELLLTLQQCGQLPFNAGQFMFVNTNKMAEHFKNVCWFMDNWPGDYFFEQAFMVQYFCRNMLTAPQVIQDEVKIGLIHDLNPETKLHDDTNVLIHFAGPPLQYQRKLDFIHNYRNAHIA